MTNINYQTALRRGLANALSIGQHKVTLTSIGSTAMRRLAEAAKELVVEFNIKLSDSKPLTANQMDALLQSRQVPLLLRTSTRAAVGAEPASFAATPSGASSSTRLICECHVRPH